MYLAEVKQVIIRYWKHLNQHALSLKVHATEKYN